MSYVVRHKESGNYLMSPFKFGGPSDQCEFWTWNSTVRTAHHFTDRAEAKSTLRELLKSRSDSKMRDFTFERAPQPGERHDPQA